MQYSVRQFVDAAAQELGIELQWQGEGVQESGTVVRVRDAGLGLNLDPLLDKTDQNLIHGAWTQDVRGLLLLGSSCIYPKLAPQPMTEVALLSGPLELTNEPYAIARIAGIKLCESCNRQYGCDYRSVMPTNLYGPNDNFHPVDSLTPDRDPAEIAAITA